MFGSNTVHQITNITSGSGLQRVAHEPSAPSGNERVWGKVTGVNHTVDGKGPSTKISFGRRGAYDRLTDGFSTQWKVAKAEKLHTVSWCLFYCAVLMFTIGSMYTLGVTVKFQLSYDSSISHSKLRLLDIESNYGQNLDDLMDIIFTASTNEFNEKLVEMGYPAADLPAANSTGGLEFQTRVLTASIVMAEAGKSVTSNETITLFSGMFCFAIFLSTVFRWFASRNNKTIATRITFIYGQMKTAIESKYTGSHLHPFDVDADDYLRMAEMLFGVVVMFIGWTVAMNNPEAGLPPAAIGAVITYHGLIGVLSAVTEINRDALNYVKSVYHDLNRVQLNETDPEAAAQRIDTTKFGESLDEVESMFLKDMHLL